MANFTSKIVYFYWKFLELSNFIDDKKNPFIFHLIIKSCITGIHNSFYYLPLQLKGHSSQRFSFVHLEQCYARTSKPVFCPCISRICMDGVQFMYLDHTDALTTILHVNSTFGRWKQQKSQGNLVAVLCECDLLIKILVF
jgi:hypothetical protein